MGQSLVKNYIHIVFSTKNRRHWIKPSIEKELHAYLGGTCNELGSQAVIVGGYTNHIHILCMLSKKMALMTLVQKVKANSSAWVKTKGPEFVNFFWQKGYGAFSVRYDQAEVVINYIKNQHEHHNRKITFKEEYRKILKENEIEFDETYVWE